MNKTGIIVIIIILVAIFGGIYISKNKVEAPAEMPVVENTMVKDEVVMVKDDAKMENGDSENMTKAGSYEAYAPEKIAMASDTHDVVLFFRAGWCPTCRALDSNIKANLGNIPSNLTILDVDYDNSTTLKQKYGVTYQHTFVQVDKDGNLIKKWSGSPTLDVLITEIN